MDFFSERKNPEYDFLPNGSKAEVPCRRFTARKRTSSRKLEPLSKICRPFHALCRKRRWWPKMFKSVFKPNNNFSEEIIIAWIQEKTITFAGTEPHLFYDNGRSHTASVTVLLRRWKWEIWNIHRTHPMWVHAITITSPTWKNHCEAPGTTQKMNLSVLHGSRYGTSTKMEALMVYDAFQTFGKRW